jgi:hypothetical protein
MKRISRFTTALLLLGTLAACALPGSIVPNTTTADELLKKFGKPSETRANPGGGEFWDYAYGPTGTETWRFGVDGGRTVRSKEQLLTHARLYKVITGTTTESQVRELLGKPSQIMNLGTGPVWEWRVNLQPTLAFFFVSFDGKGLVASKGVVMDFTADGNGDKSSSP